MFLKEVETLHKKRFEIDAKITSAVQKKFFPGLAETNSLKLKVISVERENLTSSPRKWTSGKISFHSKLCSANPAFPLLPLSWKLSSTQFVSPIIRNKLLCSCFSGEYSSQVKSCEIVSLLSDVRCKQCFEIFTAWSYELNWIFPFWGETMSSSVQLCEFQNSHRKTTRCHLEAASRMAASAECPHWKASHSWKLRFAAKLWSFRRNHPRCPRYSTASHTLRSHHTPRLSHSTKQH